ncbi:MULTISPECIES: response regulator transcription factor [Jeotgalicoccus]|uniref:response regulator transcription factor n=1 Tax=Jeotgalicoccus TaxID=227979 RepID=UPI0009FEB0EE|nr:response regulator [Jeotgalicoccus sp. S0W5]
MYLKEEQWDLICLDLMLPGLSGETLLEKIKSFGTTPIIVISAKDDQGVKIDALRSGEDDSIVKPFDVDEVAARIDSVLRKSKGANKIEVSILKYKDIVVDLQAKYVNHKLKITC